MSDWNSTAGRRLFLGEIPNGKWFNYIHSKGHLRLGKQDRLGLVGTSLMLLGNQWLADLASNLMGPEPSCLIPRFDGAILSREWKKARQDKFVMCAPLTANFWASNRAAGRKAKWQLWADRVDDQLIDASGGTWPLEQWAAIWPEPEKAAVRGSTT